MFTTKEHFDAAMIINTAIKQIAETHRKDAPTLLMTVLSGMAHRDGVSREAFLKLAGDLYDFGTRQDAKLFEDQS